MADINGGASPPTTPSTIVTTAHITRQELKKAVDKEDIYMIMKKCKASINWKTNKDCSVTFILCGRKQNVEEAIKEISAMYQVK
jgi:hypothetical protein